MRRACRLPLIVAGSATSGVAVPLALTGAITALLVVLPFVDRGVSDTPVLFYTVPVGVCAVRFGLRGGLFAAAIGVAIAVAWHLDGDHFRAGLIGFGAQTAVFVSVGTLVGASADGRRGLARLLGMHELTDTIQLLSLAHSFEEVQEIVRHAARTLTGADGATFVLRDGGYCHYVDEDAISPLWKGQRFPLEACISGWSMLNREPAVIEDIYADERIPHDAYRPTFVKSLVMVPIRKTDPIGAIGNYWATQHRASQRELDALSALAESTAVALESVQAKQQLEESRLEVLHRLALAAECRDDETLEHTYRVATLSGLLAERLGLSTEEAAILGTAAPLHDIGKLGVPDSILLKRGALSHEEREQMKLHTTAGAAILANSDSHVLRAAHQIALTHHEWWDGSGYPNRLRGNEIPLSGRIVAVADVFDALTHDRPYKPAWPVEQALAEIERLSGHQFDPQIVQAFATLDHRAVLARRHPRLAVA